MSGSDLAGSGRIETKDDRGHECGRHTLVEHHREHRVFIDGRRHVFNHEIRSEEHTSELQSLMRISYAVFCLKKKNTHKTTHLQRNNTAVSTTIQHHKSHTQRHAYDYKCYITYELRTYLI